MDYQDVEEFINPDEIKQEEEFMHCDETNPTDWSELLRDLKVLEDTVLKAETTFGEIVDKWQNYFGDHISCNFNLMLDWLLSIKSSLDEVTQKYRADQAPPSSPSCQDFLHSPSDEDPLKLEPKLPEDDDDHGQGQRRMRSTRSRKPVLTFKPDSSSSSSSEDSTGAHSNLSDDWTPPSPQAQSPQPKSPSSTVPSKKRGKYKKKNPEKLPKKKKNPDIRSRQKAECHICHKVLATRDGLKSHIQLLHEPDQLKFRCTLCARAFDRKSQLDSHILTHSGSKTYICETCGWSFYQYTNLVQHMRKHSDERPLKCDQCEESFKYPQSLKSHVQTKHSERGNQCAECGKTFPTEGRLKRHEGQVHQTVRKYPCPHCEKGFKRPDHLKYHLKSHDRRGDVGGGE